MADGVTTNFEFVLPEVDGSTDTWGEKLNANFTSLDSILLTLGGKFLGLMQYKTAYNASPSGLAGNNWNIVPVSHEIIDLDSVLSLSSNVFVCGVGGTVEWGLRCASIPLSAVPTIAFKSRLYNVTDASVAAEGTQSIAKGPVSDNWVVNASQGLGQLEAGKSYRLEYYYNSSVSLAANFWGGYRSDISGMGDGVHHNLVFRK